MAEAAVCFANSIGGTVVLGVHDSHTGVEAFVGTSLDAHTVRVKIHDLTAPHLTVTIREVYHAGVRLIEISVPEGLDVYSTGKGIYTQRWNVQCLPMRPVAVARLDDERRGLDWSAQASSRALDAVDPSTMHLLRTYLRSTGVETKERLAERTDEEILTELNLLRKDRSLTRAADVLLCPAVVGAPQELLVYQHRMTRSGEADQVRRWQGPLLSAFTDCMAVVSARIGSTPVNTARGQQIAIEDYPTAAVREALTNALIHGDLREGRPVQIEHSPETLSVRSPGPLVSGVTPQNILTHGSRARFPLLATTMRVLGLAEELGQGVDRMFREMVRSGRQLPLVRVEAGDVSETAVDFVGGPPNTRLASSSLSFLTRSVLTPTRC